jgi:uncharacterized protein YgiM (DUF1202 family)
VHSKYSRIPYSLTHAYNIRSLVKVDVLSEILRKFSTEVKVLTTRFYRNEKILDADWECILDGFAPSVDLIELDSDDQDMEIILAESKEWRSNINLSRPFGILVIKTPGHEEFQSSNTYVLFSGCTALLDHLSLTWIANEIFKLYEATLVEGSHYIKQPTSALSKYASPEAERFEDVAVDYFVRKQDIVFWREHLTEIYQDLVDIDEKKSIVDELQRVTKEKTLAKNSLDSLAKRESQLDVELNKLRKQRSELDEDNNTGEKCTFIDSDSGEIIVISKTAKNALIRTVLGDEAAEDNVIGLLDKHDVSKEVQRKIGAEQMSLDAFANLRDTSIEHLGLLSRDRKKITALAEYVRNRIQESFHEQSKVKFMLERMIATTSRQLETCRETIRQNQNSLESNDDMSIRLQHILNPPTISKIVDMITLEQVYEKPKLPNIDINKYSNVRFKIKEDAVYNLQRFRSAWAANIRNKKKNPNDSSDHESLLGSEGETSETPAGAESSWTNKKTVNVVCLAAFAVLMKHISGMDKYLLGITYNFRTPNQLVGPLTDTLPFNVDLSSKSLTFDGLFASLFKVFHYCKRHGKACPSTQISKELAIEYNIPVHFEFITNLEREEWAKQGITVEDLLYEDEDNTKSFGTFETAAIGSLDEHSQYDVKFKLIENVDTIEAAVRYRKVITTNSGPLPA